MELLNKQTILNLKSRFLDLIDIEDGLLNYDYLINQMLLAIRNVIGTEEVVLYSCNVWKQELYMEASTSHLLDSSLNQPFISSLELDDYFSNRLHIRDKIPFPDFNNYDLLIALKRGEATLGYLAFRGTCEHFYSDEFLLALSKECTTFLHKARVFTNVVVEEKRYKQLFRVTEKFHSSMDMDAVLGEIIFTLQEVYPTFTYYLMLSHDNNSHSDLPIKDLEYDSENIAAMQAYVTGTAQFEDSVLERKSILYAPLKGKQGVYGVLQVIAPNTLSFPNNEVEFITLLANTAGSALENAQLYQQSKRLVSDLQLINETSHRLNSNLRLTETMNYMTEQIIHSFDAEEVGFILVSPDFEKSKVLKGSTSFLYSDDVVPYMNYIREKIKTEKDSLFIGDLTIKEISCENVYKSVMAVPMVQTGIIKGFAVVMHHQPYHFSFETFKLLQSLIHHSTLAFTNSMLREELEKMVITDHLTKLYSRNYLDDKIHQSMEEDQRGTFILIDIDNFKSVNDTYGHQIGDDVLVQVADIINSNIRDSDIGARWGGEELAIYLPRVSEETGVAIAERLVERVANSSRPKVTISCGVSYWNKEINDTFTGLFKRADKALYVAKETGKNKVVVQEDISV
ncbi:diguanylate cyclase [Bacillus sp. 31A1R]|uniref:Diguanylate cyclase n=1 Tax=Robertmurraya mangrovi TaxID=3098077 RepID=A0ABU5IZE1_9BACI|nr:diguanylate cyclase [Bacillus sp. 31A1R]MDZ5472535.1 diguanylate cyclase [Bacillus sp. 31A1R]